MIQSQASNIQAANVAGYDWAYAAHTSAYSVKTIIKFARIRARHYDTLAEGRAFLCGVRTLLAYAREKRYLVRRNFC